MASPSQDIVLSAVRSTPSLLGVPREVRDRIYFHAFANAKITVSRMEFKTRYRANVSYSLVQVCSLLNEEVREYLYKQPKASLHLCESGLPYLHTYQIPPLVPAYILRTITNLYVDTRPYDEIPSLLGYFRSPPFDHGLLPNLKKVHVHGGLKGFRLTTAEISRFFNQGQAKRDETLHRHISPFGLNLVDLIICWNVPVSFTMRLYYCDRDVSDCFRAVKGFDVEIQQLHHHQEQEDDEDGFYHCFPQTLARVTELDCEPDDASTDGN